MGKKSDKHGQPMGSRIVRVLKKKGGKAKRKTLGCGLLSKKEADGRHHAAAIFTGGGGGYALDFDLYGSTGRKLGSTEAKYTPGFWTISGRYIVWTYANFATSGHHKSVFLDSHRRDLASFETTNHLQKPKLMGRVLVYTVDPEADMTAIAYRCFDLRAFEEFKLSSKHWEPVKMLTSGRLLLRHSNGHTKQRACSSTGK